MVEPRKIVPLISNVSPALAMVPAAASPAVAAPAAVPHLQYHGGPVLGSAEVVLIFWGAHWTGAGAPLQASLNAFFDFILTSSFMATLQEYSIPSTVIGNGRRVTSVNVSSNPGSGGQVTDAQIQKALQGWISANTVPATTTNTLYFIYLPPNVVCSFQGGASCTAFCGYHEHINNAVFYAVEPYITCVGCSFGSILDSLTKVSSHELAEAITDPAGTGWWDPNTGDEIGDICNTSTTRLGGYLVQNQWSNARSACVLATGAPYHRFLLHTGTPLAQAEDHNGDFLIADYDRDGIPDLFFIKRKATGTNTIEVHVLSGKSNYQQFILHTGTALAQAEDANGDFFVADYNGDGIPDLFFIKRRNTGTNTIEVHVLSGKSNYQQFLVHTGTALAQSEDLNGSFAIADFDRDGIPDLFFIKRRNTGTNTIEVHVLTGKSNYQQFVVHTGTPLTLAEDKNGDFLVSDFDHDGIPDLFFIKRRNTGTNTIEVHVLSGIASYRQFTLHTGTALAQGEDLNGSFQVADFDRDSRPDLFFVKRRNTGTNSIEVHVLAEAP
jgi:hypothetical protein